VEEVGGGMVKACMDMDGSSSNDAIIDLVLNGDRQFWIPIVVDLVTINALHKFNRLELE